MRKTPAARLAACLLTLGLWACGGGGSDAPGAEAPAGGSVTERGNTGAQTAPGEPIPLGVQPVADTPVAKLPNHPGHEPIAQPSPQPGVVGQGLSLPPPAQYKNQYVVSPQGDDKAAGSAAAPFRSIGKAVSVAGPGDLIRVLSGTYDERVVLKKKGTPAARITLQGEGSPRLTPGSGSGAVLQFQAPYWVVDGFEVDLQGQAAFAVTFQGDVSGSVLANSELHDGTLGGAITTYDDAKGATIENNHIHGFQKTGGNGDSHGVVVQASSKDITVRNNDIHDNSGDSVQCLGPEGFSQLPPADGLLVENNHFYDNRENAVDIKTCKNVVVRNNRMHGFKPSSTAKGDAVVVHMSASNVTVEGNDISDAAKGISVGGNHEGPVPSGVVVRRNRVHDITKASGGEGSGIRLENSDGTVVVNNTVTGVAGTALLLGHGTGGPTSNLTLQNNIIDGETDVSIGSERPGLKIGKNLYGGAGRFLIGTSDAVDFAGFQAKSGDKTSSLGNPGLDRATFAPGSAAIDQGQDVKLKFCGAAPDIGAVETGC
jgi:nitrous oxidase accessory protein NosD